MLEITKNDKILKIKNSDNNFIIIDSEKSYVFIEEYLLDFPWEYEKSWILAEIKEFQWNLFYSLVIEWKIIFIVFDDNVEPKQELIEFFWDIDVLFINTTKNSNKFIENVEAKVIIPFWEFKDIFLNSLWQHKEEVEVFKIKSDLSFDNTEFVNLK